MDLAQIGLHFNETKMDIGTKGSLPGGENRGDLSLLLGRQYNVSAHREKLLSVESFLCRCTSTRVSDLEENGGTACYCKLEES